MHIYAFLPFLTASPEIKHIAAAIFAKPIRAAQWSPSTGGMSSSTGGRSGEGSGREKIGVVTRSSGAVYVWDEEGWEDVDGSGPDDAGGGVMEGIGIPNGMFLPQQRTASLRSSSSIRNPADLTQHRHSHPCLYSSRLTAHR